MINTTKMKQDAEEGLRIAEVATEGPIRVNRYDNEGGSISYQLQQDGPGDTVLCAFDDDEDERAIFDAAFHADARTRAPEAYRNVIALAEALESDRAPMSPEDEKLVREARERYEKAYDSFWKGDPDDPNSPRIAFAGQDVPALCDLADRQAAENERLRVELAQCKADAARLGALACDRQFTDG